jgi:hypothetical protein
LALAAILTGPVFGQTAAQLLEKGVYAQETEGNLDNAILIYRQVVNSGTNQRDIAAQAQYRLGQALLQKGDLKTASQEFERLARDFSEYQGLVSSLSAQQHGPLYSFQLGTPDGSRLKKAMVQMAGIAGLATMSFDENKKVTITGKAIQVTTSNPTGAILLEDPAGVKIIFETASARAMSQQGITRDSLKPEDTITINGVMSSSGEIVENALAGRADKVVVNGKTIFDRASIVPDPPLTQDQIAADERKAELTKVIADLKARMDSLQGYPDVSEEMRALQEKLLQLTLEKRTKQ